MATTKLTLSADEQVIEDAKQIARELNTSVSALFSNYICSLKQRQATTLNVDSLPPLTGRALGMVNLPREKTDREMLEDALNEKHGLEL